MSKFVLIVFIFSLIFAVSAFSVEPPEKPPQLPSGPEGPGRFGAHYAHLKYEPSWDAPWRVADHPDVVVRFEDYGHKFVFWRGTSFIPCWVTDTGVWYTNEFVERRGAHSPNTEGCCEPMSDKQCRYSHVRIIESNDARVVVHWRYSPVDVRYEHPFIDKTTGWSDWVDEYYTIYPNAVGVRKITVYTNRPDLWTEFQESIVVNQPGTLPDDNIELGAVSVANMKGESKTYYWDENGGPDFDGLPPYANILKINLKGSTQTFALVAPPEEKGNLITTYKGHGRNSHFNWWDHWPVSQLASDGRAATSAARPSHSSLCHIGLPGKATVEWKPYAKGEKWRTKIMMHGMTTKPVADLVPLAKSWLSAPELKISGSEYTSAGYDPTQMAYVIQDKNQAKSSNINIEINANSESPMINPALVVKGWGEADADVKMDGKSLKRGNDFRLGLAHTLEGSDLVLWLKKESVKPVKLSIEPVRGLAGAK
jgi:hypothetical protein